MTIAQGYARIRHFHREARVVAFASGAFGRFAVLVAACALLLPRDEPLLRLACASLALYQLAPASRNEILALAGVFVLYVWAASWLELSREALVGAGAADLLIAMAFGAGISYACYGVARAFPRLPRLVRRRPQIVLHLLVLTAMLAIAQLPGAQAARAGIAGVAAAALASLVWRFGYVLLSGKRGSATRSRFADHFLYLWPVFGGTAVPYGKGYDHLSRHSAGSPEARARSQLAGLKLLSLAWLWQAVSTLLGGAVHADAGNLATALLGGQVFAIPRLHVLIQNAPGEVAPLALRWTSLFLELVTRTLEIAIEGHIIVGVLRLLGFHVFRNTYKPLLAESIVDFWNRFHHYFKELLVEFFFLPTYLAYFKRRPRLRLFAAVFAAACLGNLYFHLLSSYRTLLPLDAGQILALTAPRAFYSLLLALGIFVSMLREQRRRGAAPAAAPGFTLRRLRRIAGVWLFFGLIHIWSVVPSEMSFAQRNAFFLSLFGG